LFFGSGDATDAEYEGEESDLDVGLVGGEVSEDGEELVK